MPCLKRIETDKRDIHKSDIQGIAIKTCSKRIETQPTSTMLILPCDCLSSMPCLKRIETLLNMGCHEKRLYHFIV